MRYSVHYRNSKGNAFYSAFATDYNQAITLFNALTRVYRTVIMYEDDKIIQRYDNDF